jgi:flavorubredoxin
VSGDPVPPLRLADDVWWLGECLEIEHEGRPIHAYSSLYLVAGERASLLVDTGHPKDWPEIERQLDVLHREGVPAVAYVFPTHAEVPHAANLGRLLARYPDAVAVGDIRDYHLFFPEVETRLVPMRAGEEIDLGGRRFLLLEAVIRDLVTSLWGYDAASRTLFPGDGFAYMHHHQAGECWRSAEELPELPIPALTALFNAYALYWTRFTDIEPSIAALDALLARHPTAVIASGHGSPILDPAATIPRVLAGLRLGSGAVGV